MAEETNNTQTAEENSVPNPSTKAEERKDSPLHENPRFKEVIGQRNQAREEIAKYQATEKAAEEKLLQDKGEYKTILAKRDTDIENLTSSNEALKADINSFRDGLVNQISEERRYVAEGMSITNLQKFVQDEQVTANAGKTDSSRAGTTAKGDFGGYDSLAEFAMKDPKGCDKHLAESVKGYQWGKVT